MSLRYKLSFFLMPVHLLLLAGIASSAPLQADLVLRNGRIHTVDDQRPEAQAVAIHQGRYVAVGSDEQIAEWIGPATSVYDLKGAMAMPGVNDVHQHPISGGWDQLYTCKVSARLDLTGVLAAVSACVKRSEPGAWIIGGNWGIGLISQLAKASALEALDRVSMGHPVLLTDQSYHNRWANSEAMRRAGVGNKSVSPPGGEIVMDAETGQPTGLFKEFVASQAVQAQVPARSMKHRMLAAQEALRVNSRYGITGVLDAYTTEDDLQVWQAIDQQEPLPLWLKAALVVHAQEASGAEVDVAATAVRARYRSERLMPDHAKLFLDGVPAARTALFLEPYLEQADSPAHMHGKSIYSPAQLLDLLLRLDRQGIPVKMHTTGDGAVRLALDTLAEVRARNGTAGPRHQLAHAGFVAPQDVQRFKALNVTADMSPMLWYPTGIGEATAAVIGRSRAGRRWPIRSLLESGALVAPGSDWPAGQESPNPWPGIQGMVTRANPFGEFAGSLWPEQAVDLTTALRLYTLDGARALGMDAHTGSVTVGKSADLIVLDRHLFSIPVAQVHQTRVLRTYSRGRLVYQAEE